MLNLFVERSDPTYYKTIISFSKALSNLCNDLI